MRRSETIHVLALTGFVIIGTSPMAFAACDDEYTKITHGSDFDADFGALMAFDDYLQAKKRPDLDSKLEDVVVNKSPATPALRAQLFPSEKELARMDAEAKNPKERRKIAFMRNWLKHCESR